MKLSKSHGGFSALVVVLLVVVLMISGVAWWRLSTLQKNGAQKSNSTQTQVVELSVYENKDIGFKFSYPKDWGEVQLERLYGCGKTGSAYQLDFTNQRGLYGGIFGGALYSKDYASDCKQRQTGFDVYPACGDIPESYFADLYRAEDVCIKSYADNIYGWQRTGVTMQKAFKNPNYGGIEFVLGGMRLGDYSQNGLNDFYKEQYMANFVQQLIDVSKSITEL